MFVELLLAVAAVSPVSDAARMEVVCAETGFSRAAEAKDKAAFLSFVHPDARFVTGQVARGREQIGEAWDPVLAEDGPTMCSGLPVQRYSAGELHNEFGEPFTLLGHEKESHHTPWGSEQKFVYCFCRKVK